MPETCNGIDDNCNGMIDEGFPGLGSACTAGVGACLRYGAVSCNSAGTGTTCGAVAGPPGTETCNHIDDDCDGQIDEDFTNLGQACSVGLGICQRFGTYVCGGGLSVCSATPGSPMPTETCNYLDDNCNGMVDEGYLDPLNGLYDTDANCGACGNNCATQYTVANSHGACAVVGSAAQCVMKCNAGAFDLDGSTADGCEFVLDATAIYVSANDGGAVDDSTCGLGPTGTGTGYHPCKSISYGLTRASATGRSRVDVADATYNESVTVVNGKNLYGGYAAGTWVRDLANTSTVIEGVSSAGSHDSTVIASAITSATVVEGFVIRGSDNTKASGNSYAIYISGSNASLTIRSNQIFAGRGGAGTAGNAGNNGAPGANGAAYSSAAYDSFTATGSGQCNSSNDRGAYGQGLHTCGTSINGGNGGGNNCTPVRSTQSSTASYPATAGQSGGGAGGGPGGVAGSSGYDGQLQATTCYVPVSGSTVLPNFGNNGNPGGIGGNGAAVAGCASATGTIVGGHWAGGGGASGIIGFDGGGGGGGGAGGGAACTTTSACKDMLGGHGGGGAAGGCGGTGGIGGMAGGGAFGIFIVGGTAPTITGNTIALGSGGGGGSGGIGGAGGLGGTGSEGGLTGALFCTGKGGRGGDGGNGGAGSGGGGGCGGSSYGIFTSGVGTPSYCSTNTIAGGTAGVAGAGGYSGGNSGGAGNPGIVSACTSI
jgi:hypothetical protein